MAAYMIGLGRIDDQERFAQYLEGVVPTILAFGGRPLVVEDPAEVLEGNPPFPRVVVLEFPTIDDARNWYNSPEYTAIKEHRLASSEHVLYAASEFAPPGQ